LFAALAEDDGGGGGGDEGAAAAAVEAEEGGGEGEGGAKKKKKGKKDSSKLDSLFEALGEDGGAGAGDGEEGELVMGAVRNDSGPGQRGCVAAAEGGARRLCMGAPGRGFARQHAAPGRGC
jgi:hypothetical protein